MELIIIRHAVAEERETFAKKGLEDQLRPLTLKGRKKMQKICQHIHDHIKGVDVIVTSPLVRARQTADIISQFYLQAKIIEAPELAPHCAALAFIKWLRTQGANYKKIIIVGHEPHLSTLASLLISGKNESFIDLRKSGIIGIELESFSAAEAGHGHLLYAIPPRFFGP